jgi:hypothetical protein
MATEPAILLSGSCVITSFNTWRDSCKLRYMFGSDSLPFFTSNSGGVFLTGRLENKPWHVRLQWNNPVFFLALQ